MGHDSIGLEQDVRSRAKPCQELAELQGEIVPACGDKKGTVRSGSQETRGVGSLP
jgi:hypothetical protein